MKNRVTGWVGSFVFAWMLSSAAGADPVREAVTLYSDGTRLAGDIWRPEGLAAGETRPGLLLVHGWGGVKSHLNQAYAPQFAALGYVVLTFDYTGWGDSEGVLVRTGKRSAEARGAKGAVTYTTEVREIRQIVNPLEQLDDIRAAYAFLVTDKHVDAARTAVWGTSLGGGLALATAIEFPEIDVLIAQVGSVNPAAGRDELPDDNPLSAPSLVAWRGAIARGDSPSFPTEAAPGLTGAPDWPDFARYDPYTNLDNLRAATLIVDAAQEELFDIRQNGLDLYGRIKDRLPARYETIDGKHYDVYRDEGYASALAWAQDWLRKHLPADGAPEA